MKVDDDMFVNVNKLIYELKCLNLKNTSNTNLASNSSFNSNKSNHLLMGSLIKGAKPIADSANKWLVFVLVTLAKLLLYRFLYQY